MLFSIRDGEVLENLNELVSLNNQVKTVRLQDNLGKQNFQGYMKKVFEPMTDAIKSTSDDLAKTMILTAKENNQAVSKLNQRF